MKVVRAKRGVCSFELETLVDIEPEASAGLQTGMVFIEAGYRHPVTGVSVHAQHEVSLVLEGELELETAQGVRRVIAGDLVHIAPGEAHVTTALSDSRVYFALFGPADPSAERRRSGGPKR